MTSISRVQKCTGGQDRDENLAGRAMSSGDKGAGAGPKIFRFRFGQIEAHGKYFTVHDRGEL